MSRALPLAKVLLRSVMKRDSRPCVIIATRAVNVAIYCHSKSGIHRYVHIFYKRFGISVATADKNIKYSDIAKRSIQHYLIC